MLPFLPLLLTQAPAHPMEASTLDFCRQVAKAVDWTSTPKPTTLRALKGQAVALQPLVRTALGEDSRVLPLLDAALGVLEAALGDEVQGEARYLRAAQRLGQRWQATRKALGPRDARRLQELEVLALLAELGGLRPTPWRDEALRLRPSVESPSPCREKAPAAAVADHYGPWLTVAEVDPMLEFAGHLARAWLAQRTDQALTQRVLEVGLKPGDAHRVWTLCARKAGEGLRRDLETLLDRLDPGVLLERTGPQAPDPTLSLFKSLVDTPLELAGRKLLRRLDVHLAKLPTHRALRLQVALALQEWDRAATLLEADLVEAQDPESVMEALNAAAHHLALHPHGDLLATGTGRVKRLESSDLAKCLETWASLQHAAGHPEDVEALLRLRQGLETGPGIPGELLVQLGRWKELLTLLGPAPPTESLDRLGYRFQAARGLGQEAEALKWLEAWLQRVAQTPANHGHGRLPGLSWGIPRLGHRGELLARLGKGYGPALMPGQEALLAKEPWRILAAMDPEAPGSLAPGRAEESLRWRWNRVDSSSERLQELEKILEEAERDLGSSHPLVGELLTDLAHRKGPEALDRAERAVRILEAKGSVHALVKALAVQAQLCGLADGPKLEASLRRLLDVLMGMTSKELEGTDLAEELPILLLLHLWREQRLDEVAALGPRLLAFHKTHPKLETKREEVAQALDHLARIHRRQGFLAAAGLGPAWR